MKRLALLSLVAILACSSRERANPFDPHNPGTGGAPVGLRLLSNRDTVWISWSPVEVDDLKGYTLYRGLDGDPLKVLVELPADCTAYVNTPVTYDRSHGYALQSVTEFDRSDLSDSLFITPGPVNFWIADLYGYNLWRQGYDGVRDLGSEVFITPIAVEYDSSAGTVWVADYAQRRVYAIDRQFRSVGELELEASPVDLALDSAGGRLFLVERDSRELKIYSTGGLLLATLTLPGQVSLYSALAFDPRSASLWLTIDDQGQIIRLNLDGDSQEVLTGYSRPWRCQAAPLEGGCWVATEAGVVYLDSSAAATVYLPEYVITAISVNRQNGDCYYTGHRGGRWETGRIHDGEREIILGNEYPNLYGIQVVPGTGRVGFIVNQVGTWKLIRFDAQGRPLGERGGFNHRLDFALE